MTFSMPGVIEDAADTLPTCVPSGEVSGYVTWYDICERQDTQELCPILRKRLGQSPSKADVDATHSFYSLIRRRGAGTVQSSLKGQVNLWIRNKEFILVLQMA